MRSSLLWVIPCFLLVASARAAEAAPPAGAPAASGVISFTMPRDGWATVAINNAAGARVRNLFGNLGFTKGTHTVEWDGCDDNGKPVAPGEYRWVGLYHGDMHALYRGAFQYGTPPWRYGETGGWTADHSSTEAVVAVGDRVVIGAPEAESGHGFIAADLDGKKLWGKVWLAMKNWACPEALAAVGDRVFASSHTGPDSVWEIDPATGNSWIVMEKKEIPPDKLNVAPRPPFTTFPALRVVGGHAAAGGTGELYVTDLFGKEPRTYVFAPGKAPGDRLALLRVLPVRPWGLAWLPDGRCVAAMDRTIEVLDTQTGATTPLVSEGLSAPAAIATDSKGRIYVSDQGDTGILKYSPDSILAWRDLRLTGESSQQIKIFDSKGAFLRAIGKKGGQQPGKIDPESFWQPAGIAVDARGRLWVTELTMSPKRVSVWEIPDDLASTAPKLARQFFGPAAYGGGAEMIDPTQPWRIMDTDYGVIFDVDIATGAYAPVDLPWRIYDTWKQHGYRPDLPFMGTPSTVYPVEGRKFGACNGGYGNGAEAQWEQNRNEATGPVLIGEYKDDVFVPKAAIGNIRMWLRDRELHSRGEEQWLPPAVLDAARKLPDWPKYAAEIGMAPDASDVPHVYHVRNSGAWLTSKWPKEISGFIWVDANGDGRMQAGEIQFHEFPDADAVTLDSQLNAYMSANRKPDAGVYKIPRQGFNSVGAPVYKWDAVQKISDEGFGVEQVGDDGTLLSDGALHGPDGKLIWSYPVHPERLKALGSNIRNAMEPGSIYSINTLQGVAKGPGNLGPVYMLHSTDGMSYFLTRDDGLFICMMFRPFQFGENWNSIPEAKPGMELDKYTVGEESFNGSFSRAEATGHGFESGHFYLTGMSRSAVVELTGLDGVQRFTGGGVSLVAGAGLYGKGGHLDPAALSQTAPVDLPPPLPLETPQVVPGVEAFRAKPAQFSTATVWTAWDNRGLHMKWHVDGDSSPFINNEQDWTRAFTTGDVCDVQLKSPTLGRCRYIITMNQGQPVVVRFLYDAKDAGHGATYMSSVNETRVPDVEKINAPVSVKRGKQDYSLQVTLPWEVLGVTPKPGLALPMELGVFFSDPTGHKTLTREYWHSRTSGMVSDVPTEAQPTSDWGTLQLK